jgi:hypothetical protein
MRIPAQLRRHRPGERDVTNGEALVVEIEPGQLTGMFAAPGWLRDLGVMSWLLVGVAALLGGTIWLLATVETIVIARARAREKEAAAEPSQASEAPN